MFSLSEDPAKVLSPGKELSFCERIILRYNTWPGLQVSCLTGLGMTPLIGARCQGQRQVLLTPPGGIHEKILLQNS